MKSVYLRENLIITEFDNEDVITTSAVINPDPTTEPATEPVVVTKFERENKYISFKDLSGGSWF